MNFKRISYAVLLTIVGVAGCASDPAKKVNGAEAELHSDQQKAHADERDTNATATNKQETAHAESAADKNAATTDGKKDVAVARADMAQERRDVDAKIKERLAKADSKAKELSTKSAKLTGKKAADFKNHQTNFNTQRSETAAKVTTLESSSNDAWSSAKTDVEKKLDSLENAVAMMEKDF